MYRRTMLNRVRWTLLVVGLGSAGAFGLAADPASRDLTEDFGSIAEDASTRFYDANGTVTFTACDDSGISGFATATCDLSTGQILIESIQDKFGSGNLVVSATDNDDVTVDWTLTLNVTAVNDAPTLVSPIVDVTVDEDGGDETVDLSAVFDDVDIATDGDSLTYSASTSGDPLFSSVDVSGTTLTLSFAADQNGTATVSVRATDSVGAFVEDTFTVVVNAINDAPVVATPPGTATFSEDDASPAVDFSTVFDDVDIATDLDSLILTVVSLVDGGVIDTAKMVGETLELTLFTDQNGSGSATVRATDTAGTFVDATVDIEVTAVNDAPTVVNPLSDVTVDEDAGDETVDLSAVFDDVDIATDGDSLTYSASTSGDPLFSSVDVSGTTLTLSFAADQNGTATVPVRATDSMGAFVEDTVTVTVNPVNDAPAVIQPISDVNTVEDGPDIVIDLTAVFGDPDVATNGDVLTYDATVGNAGLFEAINIAGGTLTLDLAFDQNGDSSVQVTATDANGASAADSFSVVVSPVNDVPDAVNDATSMEEDGQAITISVMCDDYLAEEPTSLTSAGVDGFSESEPTTVLDRNGDPISEPNGQVSIISGGATCADGTVTDAVRYQPKTNFHGEDFFNYTITDSDGDTSTATATVTVTPVNDAPEGLQQRDFVMEENQVLTVTAETGLLAGSYDADGALLDENGIPVGETLTVSEVVFPSVGSLTLDTTTGTFEYQPPVDFVGEVEFQYRLYDGAALSTGEAYRVRVAVLQAAPPPEPPPAGEVATIFNLANAPLEQSTGVPPNVVVVMDDSGSMDWHLVVGTAGHDGTFTLDNGDVASGNRQRSTNYSYLWDLRNNAYPPTSGNGRILPTEQALDADSDMAGNNYGVWRARTHLYNPIYYNPAIRYSPWVGQDAANDEFTDADPNNVRLDPRDPTQTIDLLALHDYKATSIPEWHGGGGSKTVQVVDLYLPRYYRTTAEPPLESADPRELVEIRPDGGPLEGGLYPGGRDREDCALDGGNPNICTYEREIQNFANYFQYYRSREYVTKNGMGKVISQLQDIRIGYMTISATTTEDIREMNALHTEGNKKALLDNVYRVDSYGGTPLRQALGRAGDTIAGTYGRMDDPVLPAPEGFCQQSFTLLFSDGYWNGGTGTTGNPDGDNDTAFDGGRYADGVDATLADVAMYYYETDLRPELDDQVPVMRRDSEGVPDGVFPDVDATMHQHMKTYAIAFGVTGTLNPADVPADPTTPFDWPDPFAGNQEKVDDMLHTAVNGRGRFLSAGNPQELQAALESAFLEFTQAASSTSSAAFNSTSLREGTLLYRGFYDLRDNTGELTATRVNDDGSLATEPVWRASERLNPAFKLPNNRVITSFDPDGGAGLAFRHGNLTPDQQLTLNQSQVDYLRGVRSDENPAGPLRERPASSGLLGDIVNSSPVFVGAPRAINRDQKPFPVADLYSDFVDSVQSRAPVVYVGANDGMLHGFNGLTGDELFAYVPNKIIDSSQGHHNPLDQFTSPFYQHRYFVDLSPRLNDVYMRGSRTSVSKSWNTVLVGGLGAGGKGFFALNVTRPDTSFSSEGNAAGTVLWEFTDEDDTYPVDDSGTPLGGAEGAITDPSGDPVKDLGYSVSPPVVAMSNVGDGGSPDNKEWVAIFGNGPNSTAGIAKLFVLFMDRGLNGWQEGDFVKLNTGFGVQSSPHPLAGYPNSLGTPAAVDADLDGTVDRVYAGDRLGNLFRFDISDANSDNWTVTRIFTASYTDPDTGDQTIQPILGEPTVVKHPTERGFLVMFGTGSHLTRDDVDSADIQSIYGIWDEGSSSPVTAQDDTKAVRLVEQTITNVMDGTFDPPTVRRIVSRTPVNYQQEEGDTPGTYGWYIDLDMEAAEGDSSGRAPPEPQFPGEKAIRRLLFRDGTIITTTVLPSLDEFSCFGARPGSILVFDALTGGDAGRPVVDFNTDGVVDSGDLVAVGDDAFAGGILFNQEDLDGQLVDLSTLGGEGDTDFLFVSGGNETISYRIDDVNDNRTGRLSWRELDAGS